MTEVEDLVVELAADSRRFVDAMNRASVAFERFAAAWRVAVPIGPHRPAPAAVKPAFRGRRHGW